MTPARALGAIAVLVVAAQVAIWWGGMLAVMAAGCSWQRWERRAGDEIQEED